MRVALTLALLTLLPLAAQEKPAETTQAPVAAPKPLELTGTLIPARAEELRVKLEAWKGELTFLQVLPHGTLVAKDQVVARFDPEGLTEQLEELARERASRALKLDHLKRQHALAGEAEAEKLQQAESGLARALRALEGYEKVEVEFGRRQAELQARQMQANIDDQMDELAQLEAMYRADELVDATEEIVLKRSRRQLATTLEAQKLQQDRRAYQVSFEEPMERERRREAVAAQKLALEHLKAGQEMARQGRQDEAEKAARELEKLAKRLAELGRDREALALKAPAGGLLLHGGVEGYRPGQAAPRFREGGKAGAGVPLFCIAQPGSLAVALAVPEAQAGRIRPGVAVQATPLFLPGRILVGTLRLEAFPDPATAGAPENAYRAEVELTSPAPGLAPGMRVKVRLPDAEGEKEEKR